MGVRLKNPPRYLGGYQLQAFFNRLLTGVRRVRNRQIRIAIYHLIGRPLTGRLAVALIFSGNTAQLNGQVNGTAKANA
jgi:hypothetical protein